MKAIIIGTGNVATQLGRAMRKAGFATTTVSGRNTEGVDRGADLYIFAIKDSALHTVLRSFPSVSGLLVHTAGSVPMDIFAATGRRRYGVFYPLQTFSKRRAISFAHIPLFIEANNEADEKLLLSVASALSDRVQVLSSDKRRYLHLAAVFACNFTNHLYTLASQIVEEQGLEWDVLLPLIAETAAKVKQLSPRDAQTGPAVRADGEVICKHLALLQNDSNKETIYYLLSNSIYHLYKD